MVSTENQALSKKDPLWFRRVVRHVGGAVRRVVRHVGTGIRKIGSGVRKVGQAIHGAVKSIGKLFWKVINVLIINKPPCSESQRCVIKHGFHRR